LKVKAKLKFVDKQTGEVFMIFADISEQNKEFGFMIHTPLSKGSSIFIDWYRSYFNK
jgi:hypothetical protein